MLAKHALPALVTLCIAITVTAWASEPPYQRLAPGTLEQWSCTTTPPEHWIEPHHISDAGFWKPVSVGTAAPYPDEIEPWDQYRWPFIWAGEDVEPGKAVYFRRWFTLDGQVNAATLRFCSYGEKSVVYLNGEQIAELDQPGSLTTIDITNRVQSGANHLAVAVIRGAKSYGLLVMGEAELTWPPDRLQWLTKNSLERHEMVLEQAQVRDKAPVRAARWTITPFLPNGADSGWQFTEPGLSLDWEGTSYPTVHPHGGMPEHSTAYFKTHFATYGAVTSAVLQVLGDDSYEVYVNGFPVAVEKRMGQAYIPCRVDVTEYVHEGNKLNTIAARVTNDWGPGRIHIQPTVTICF